MLSGDILGDWREEVVWRTSDNTALRIYSTPHETNTRITTLLHDPMYRTALAWQNTAYNQPPHPSFFIGNGMPTAPGRRSTRPESPAGACLGGARAHRSRQQGRQATVQLWSPSLNAVGFAFVPDQLAVNPKLTDEPAATLAFQPTFFAVTVGPDCACAFQPTFFAVTVRARLRVRRRSTPG